MRRFPPLFDNLPTSRQVAAPVFAHWVAHSLTLVRSGAAGEATAGEVRQAKTFAAERKPSSGTWLESQHQPARSLPGRSE